LLSGQPLIEGDHAARVEPAVKGLR